MKAVCHLLVVLVIAIGGMAWAEAPVAALGPITVRMEVTKVPHGQWAYASGHTDPGQKIVFVQRWNGSRWYDITGVAVDSGGNFRAKLKPKDRGIYTFRVRSKAADNLSNRFYLNVGPPLVYGNSGVGGTVTGDFRLPSRWIGTMAVDCSNMEYGRDNFIVRLYYQGLYGPTYDLVANEIPEPTWSTTFTTPEAVGLAYLVVETGCAWSIRITAR